MVLVHLKPISYSNKTAQGKLMRRNALRLLRPTELFTKKALAKAQSTQRVIEITQLDPILLFPLRALRLCERQFFKCIYRFQKSLKI